MGNSPMQPGGPARFADLGCAGVLGESFTAGMFNYHLVSIKNLRDNVFEFVNKNTDMRRNTEIKR